MNANPVGKGAGVNYRGVHFESWSPNFIAGVYRCERSGISQCGRKAATQSADQGDLAFSTANQSCRAGLEIKSNPIASAGISRLCLRAGYYRRGRSSRNDAPSSLPSTIHAL
jgi:hypothetical protein